MPGEGSYRAMGGLTNTHIAITVNTVRETGRANGTHKHRLVFIFPTLFPVKLSGINHHNVRGV